jgi:nitrate/nitrite transporter NarK
MKAHIAHIQSESYKWLILAISAFTFTFVVAMPQMSLPVLFDEISADLGLSLVQVGWIWGVGSVLGILVGLIGGPVGDRFGPRRTLTVACLLMGVAGAARGLSNDFTMLALTTLITGLAQWSIPMNVHKACGVWFPKEQLGMANGVVAVGMALGFLLGFTSGVLISLAVLIAGISRDGFMALTMTAIIEEKGIGARFAGTAIGLNMSVMGVAGVFAPPVGNWLVKLGAGIPFLFWASLVLLGFVGYFFMRRNRYTK